MKYIIEINDFPLTKLGDAIAQAENRGYDKGYDKGYDNGYGKGEEDGKEAMKRTVINNIKKMFERNKVESKFQPEVAIFDACEDCFYADRKEYEAPCNGCKHSHMDHFKPKER